MLLNLLLTIFAYYLAFYFVLVIYLQSKIKKYSVRKDTVCYLATAKRPWGSVFNISTLFYGLLSLSLPVAIIKLLGANLLTVVGSTFVGLTGLATILVGLFPMNKVPKPHTYISVLAYLNVFLTATTFVFIFNRYGYFPPFMKYICYWVIVAIIPLALTAARRYKIYSFFEWIAFIGTIVWNFSLAVALLINL